MPQGCCWEQPRSWHRWQHTRQGHLGPADAAGGEQRRRAGRVSAGEGDNLCPGQLFPSSTSFLPLPGQWVKAAAAVRREQEQLSVPGHDVLRAELRILALERWFWSSRAWGAALLSVLLFWHCSVSELCLCFCCHLSREKREELSFAVSPGNSGFSSANALRFCIPPGTPAFTLNANCSLNVSVGGF